MSSLSVTIITPEERISSKLSSFVGDANKVIIQLEGPCQSSNQRASLANRLETADQIDRLRDQAKEIQNMIEQTPHILEKCPIKQLSHDFDGTAIRYATMLTAANLAESAGPDSSWDTKMWAISEPVKNSLHETAKKIKVAERESLLIYQHFNKPVDSSNESCVIS